jgi:transposase, IS5 family
MREKQQKQMPQIDPPTGHAKERELEMISDIIDNTPPICGYVRHLGSDPGSNTKTFFW